MAKRFDLPLRGTRRTFDIDVGERVRRCDFLIYYLTFHDRIGAETGIALGGRIEHLIAQIHTNGNSELVLAAALDRFALTSFAEADGALGIHAETELSGTVRAVPEQSGIGIGTRGEMHIVPMLPVAGKSTLGLSAGDVAAIPMWPFGAMEASMLGLGQIFGPVEIHGVVRPENGIVLEAAAEGAALTMALPETAAIGVSAEVCRLTRMELIGAGEAEAMALGFAAAVDAAVSEFRTFGDMEGSTLADYDALALKDVDILLTKTGGGEAS